MGDRVCVIVICGDGYVLQPCRGLHDCPPACNCGESHNCGRDCEMLPIERMNDDRLTEAWRHFCAYPPQTPSGHFELVDLHDCECYLEPRWTLRRVGDE